VYDVSQIQIEVDKDVTDLLGDSPEQIERRILESIALDLYRRREISSGRAAALLGMERFAFVRWAGFLGIAYFDMTPEEWEQELRVIEAM
jgi:hypothetical protein